MRREVEVAAMYDSRETGGPYTSRSYVGGKLVGEADGLEDPFVRTQVRVGFRDALRQLWRFGMVHVEVTVDARPGVVESVMELDENYRGAHGSERRRRSDEQLDRALRDA